MRVHARTIRDSEGNFYSLSMIQDISEQHRAHEQIESMAYHDELTGLPNRRLMLDRLGQAVARAKRYGGGVILLSVDPTASKASMTCMATPPAMRCWSRPQTASGQSCATAIRQLGWVATSS